MLFDNVTLKKGMDFAAQLYAVHRQLSPIDLRDILLGCFSGLPIAGKNQCDLQGAGSLFYWGKRACPAHRSHRGGAGQRPRPFQPVPGKRGSHRHP